MLLGRSSKGRQFGLQMKLDGHWSGRELLRVKAALSIVKESLEPHPPKMFEKNHPSSSIAGKNIISWSERRFNVLNCIFFPQSFSRGRPVSTVALLPKPRVVDTLEEQWTKTGNGVKPVQKHAWLEKQTCHGTVFSAHLFSLHLLNVQWNDFGMIHLGLKRKHRGRLKPFLGGNVIWFEGQLVWPAQ